MQPTDPRSQEIGQLVLGKGFASRAQIKECLHLQRELAEKGWHVPGLDELLVSKGYVSESRMRALLSGMKSTTLHRPRRTSRDSRQVGEPFGKFSLLDRLRANDVRRVFRAEYTPTGMEVLLHIFTRETMAQENIRSLDFRDLVTSLQALRHPHIQRIVTAGSLDNRFYYASPFVAGRTLQEYIDAGDTVEVDDAIRWMVQLVDALQFGHGKGIHHAAIEPENVLITMEGHAILTGYAIAHQVRGLDCLRRESEAYRPFYTAPEQTHGGSPDPRSDIFGLGTTMYHALTGKPPVLGRSLDDAMNAVLFEAVESPAAFRPELPRLLARMIHSMVNGDVDERPPSLTVLQRNLETLRKQQEASEASKKEAPRRRTGVVGGYGFMLCRGPECGVTFAVPLLDAGKPCTCPSCGFRQTVPREFVTVTCPQGHASTVAANLKGLPMLCRTCGTSTEVGAGGGEPIRPAPDAWIYFPCKHQNCDALLMLRKEDAGRTVLCPTCRKEMATPMRSILDPVREGISVLRFREAKPSDAGED